MTDNKEMLALMTKLKAQKIDAPKQIATDIMESLPMRDVSKFSMLRLLEAAIVLMDALYIPKPSLMLPVLLVIGFMVSQMIGPDTTVPDVLFVTLLTGGKGGAL